MKINYKLVEFLDGDRIYNNKFEYFDTLKLYLFHPLEIYNPNTRKTHLIRENCLIELSNCFYEDEKFDMKKGIYSARELGFKYHECLISKEQLNAYTIPMYLKKNSYDKYNRYDMEGIKIKKNNLFLVYETPRLDGDAKKAHYKYIDTILKKMFYNCGDIVLNSNMNTILKNVKQFDKLFAENKNMELLLEMKEYLETTYEKMLELEPEEKKIRNAKDYFELDCSSLKEDDFLKELKIKNELLKII